MAIEASSQYVLVTLEEEIGPTTLKLLKKAGFKDIRDLASAKTEELQELKLIRNLFAHGNGTVNHIFLSKSGKKDLILGEKIELTGELMNEAYSLTYEILWDFDKAFTKIFPELLSDQLYSYEHL